MTGCAIVLAALAAGDAHAQSPALTPMQEFAADDPDARMLLEANELVYDFDRAVVTAQGGVQIYYRGYTVEADSIVYDQNSARVFARGDVKVTEPDGNELYADSVELTDDFREGFIEELTLVTPERARFAAVSAERMEDNITVFNRGVYTACEPCKDGTDRPPIWQIKAARIIHNQEEQVVYYENASFELLGVPIAYVPFFSHPDPTVTRQSGFLPPEAFNDSTLGAGLKVPYFFALAPNYDLTVAATGFTKQGVLGEFQWRHRLVNGSYTIEGAGIQQQAPEEFDPGTPGDREWRGYLRTAGAFRINEFWRWGFDGRVTSDRTFQRRYRFDQGTEYRNQVFLTGQSANNWFDARVLDYQTMSTLDQQDALPVIHPVIDYNYIFGQPVLGGRLSVDVNVLSLSRESAEFSSGLAGANCNDSYARIAGLTPEQRQTFLDECNLIGAPGNYNRLVTQVSWEASLTDSLGQVFTPFMSLRGDAYALDIEDPFLEATGTPLVADYLPTGDSTVVRGMPALGLEYRWPFLISTGWGYQIIEPMAQVITRPDEQKAFDIPNEDAQSLVYDDTTLFARDKFSGYDRVEGGTRANVGVRYNLQAHNGVSAGAVFGQSYQLAGENPFPDGSGLETDRADYVAAAYVSPFESIEFASRVRLDESDFDLKRHDLQVRGTTGPLTASLTYSDIAAEPAANIDYDRSEILGSGTLRLDENWRVFGSGRLELEGPSEGSQWISHSFGFGYIDECIALAIAYERTYVRDGDIEPDERITFRVNLRTVAQSEASVSLAGADRTN